MTDDSLVLSERQQRIADWLEDKRPDLASMYRCAVSLLRTPARIDDERTRVAHICHSIRELMNRLPGAIGVAATVEIDERTSAKVQGLPALLTEFPNLDLLQDVENVPVPRKIAWALDDLMKTAILEERRRSELVAALLTDDGNIKHPAVREWLDLSRYFVKWAHLHDNQSKVSEIPSDAELASKIEVVENLIEGVLAEFFDNLHSLQDVLAQANRLDGGAGE